MKQVCFWLYKCVVAINDIDSFSNAKISVCPVATDMIGGGYVYRLVYN